jgi:hypothetical protein
LITQEKQKSFSVFFSFSFSFSSNQDEYLLDAAATRNLTAEEEAALIEEELAALEREEEAIREQVWQTKQKTTLSLSLFFFFFPGFLVPPHRQQERLMSSVEAEVPVDSGTVSDTSLISDLKSMINDAEYSDFAIVIGSDRILCHKAILSARSQYFRKLFQSNKAVKELIVKDISVSVAKDMLGFIYCGQIDLQKEKAQELFNGAGAWQLTVLSERCSKMLGGVVTGNKTEEEVEDPNDTPKNKEFRMKLAKEMTETERTYVKSLQLIFDVSGFLSLPPLLPFFFFVGCLVSSDRKHAHTHTSTGNPKTLAHEW